MSLTLVIILVVIGAAWASFATALIIFAVIASGSMAFRRARENSKLITNPPYILAANATASQPRHFRPGHPK